jgi:hypothetical protein
VADVKRSTDPHVDPAEITDAFEALIGGVASAHFEHGKWWVYESEEQAFYKVEDGPESSELVVNGFTFEALE